MKLAWYRAVGLGILLASSTACGDAVPPVTEPPAARPPGITTGFPALLRPGDIYVASEELVAELSSSDLGFEYRYVLYEDGSFARQFSCCRFSFGEFTGVYARSDSLVAFAFDDVGGLRAGTAEGAIRGDSLTVRYDQVMADRGFIGGLYVRSP